MVSVQQCSYRSMLLRACTPGAPAVGISKLLAMFRYVEFGGRVRDVWLRSLAVLRISFRGESHIGGFKVAKRFIDSHAAIFFPFISNI